MFVSGYVYPQSPAQLLSWNVGKICHCKQYMNGMTVDFNRYENDIWHMFMSFSILFFFNTESAYKHFIWCVHIAREGHVCQKERIKTENEENKDKQKCILCWKVWRKLSFPVSLSRSVWYKLEESGQEPLLPPQHGVARAQRLLLNSRHPENQTRQLPSEYLPKCLQMIQRQSSLVQQREKLGFYLKNGERLSG